LDPIKRRAQLLQKFQGGDLGELLSDEDSADLAEVETCRGPVIAHAIHVRHQQMTFWRQRLSDPLNKLLKRELIFWVIKNLGADYQIKWPSRQVLVNVYRLE
jgi:hypothetical protein